MIMPLFLFSTRESSAFCLRNNYTIAAYFNNFTSMKYMWLKIGSLKLNSGLAVFVTLLSVVSLFSACVEGDDESRPQRSYVMFFNSYSPSPSGIDFLIDNNRLRTGTVDLDSVSVYNQIYSGTWQIAGVSAGGGTTTPIAQISASLDPERYYSCFITGPSSSPQLLLVGDDLSAPDSLNHAKMRFVNLSSSAGNVDIGIKDSASIFSGQEYLKMSDYSMIDTSAHQIVVKPAAGNTPLVTLNFKAVARRIYTFYLWNGVQNNKLNLSYKEHRR